ncbi:MAG: YraN family protein [Bacteroidota bacterium]
MTQQELGIFGENLAVQLLNNKGYQILVRNYRFGKLEIDIIAKSNNQIVVIEVKTRETAIIGEPWKAVTKGKQKSIIKVASQYLKKERIDLDTRFDIVSIVHNSFHTKIEHLENAFFPRL